MYCLSINIIVTCTNFLYLVTAVYSIQNIVKNYFYIIHFNQFLINYRFHYISENYIEYYYHLYNSLPFFIKILKLFELSYMYVFDFQLILIFLILFLNILFNYHNHQIYLSHGSNNHNYFQSYDLKMLLNNILTYDA